MGFKPSEETMQAFRVYIYIYSDSIPDLGALLINHPVTISVCFQINDLYRLVSAKLHLQDLVEKFLYHESYINKFFYFFVFCIYCILQNFIHSMKQNIFNILHDL